ncbi:MAG: hypothetical protein ACK4MQ_04380 [Hyphomonas sp.]
MKRWMMAAAAMVILAPVAVADAPACGADLDAAVRAAFAEEERQQRLIDQLIDILEWTETDYAEGNISEAEYENEMRDGEEEFSAADARLKKAAAAHKALRERREACRTP